MKKDKATGGIRLRLMNYVLGGLTLGIAVLMLVTTFLAISGYNSLRRTSEAFLECREGAEEIQNASDYLTEHVRYYVGSGMRQYLDLYFEEADVTQRREKGLDTLEKHFAGTDLYDALERAVNGSKELMKVEYHAMRLRLETLDGEDLAQYPDVIQNVVLPESELAMTREEQMDQSRKLVYDLPYEEMKAEITGQVNRCLEGLEDHLQEKQASQAKQLRTLVVLEQILIILIIAAVALLVVLTSLLVFHPLIRAERLVRTEQPIPPGGGAYEYRFFAATYNRMFEASKESKERLAFKASHDYLTGIFNRSGLDRYLDSAAAGQNALVLVDLDGFKKINDTYGHDAGDRILRKLSEILSASFRSDDRISRIGGDEFAVIMWNAGVESSAMIREKIAAVNAEMRASSDEIPSASISVGVAFGGEGNGRDLFRYADRELYRVKRSGGCGISIRDGSQDEGGANEGLPEEEIDK
ncbi:MAG: GGDEF domain-containing protein [Clostridia bacterium]|nr:GGDEF domain-containing protein [Clostridia bacterium]